MRKRTKVRKIPNSNPVAKNSWKQNKPKVIPAKRKKLLNKAQVKESYEDSD